MTVLAGNDLARTLGAYSQRSWGPLADRLAEELVEEAPWLARPTFASAVAAWARVEAQLQLVMGWLDEHGLLDEDGKPRPATNLLDRLEGRAASLRQDLGRTPQALAKLLSVVAQTGHDPGGLDALREEGRRILRARAPEALGATEGEPREGG